MFNKYKNLAIVVIIFLCINLIVFWEALVLSFLTSQIGLFFGYLSLFILATSSPTLFALSLSKRNLKLLFLSVLIFVSAGFIFHRVVNYRTLAIKNFQATYVGEKENPDRIIEVSNIKKQEDLINFNFCFKVFLPNVQNFTDELRQKGNFDFYEANASVKSCENQLLIMTFGFLKIIEIPRTYNFEFRKGFEDLKSVQITALSGKKVVSNTFLYYIIPVELYGDFGYKLNIKNLLGSRKVILFYTEREDTLIFVYLDDPSTNYSEEEILKILDSMRSLN